MSAPLKPSNIVPFKKHIQAVGGNFRPVTNYNSGGLINQSKGNLLRSYNSIVYSAVRLNANAVADVDWNVFGIDRDGKPIPENDSPEAILLRSVNPLMNGNTLFVLTQAWLETAGCAFWWIKKTASGRPEVIWPLSPGNITINNIKGFSEIDFFTFTSGNGKSFNIPADEVVRFTSPSLTEPYLNNFSPLQAIWREKAIWDEESLNALALLQNHARPDAMVSPKDFSGQMDETQRRDFERQLLNKFKRQGSGGVLIASEALDYTPLTFNSKDAELLARKKVTKNDISNAFSVPLALLESENINRATLEAAMFQHGFYSIKPRVKSLQETLNEFYFPMFGRELRIRFDNPVPIDQERLAKLEDMDLKNAVITINEVRAKKNPPLEPVSWGDEPWQPNTQIQPSMRLEINGGSSHVEPDENKKQNAKTRQDCYEEFIRYRTQETDYACLARFTREAGISQETLDGWCKEVMPMIVHKHRCGSNEEKMIEWRALNDLPPAIPLQKIFRDIFSDQEQEILKALSKAAKYFDGIKIKAFPDDAVEFLNAMTLEGWEDETALRARPQIEIDTGKGVNKTVTTITASPGSPTNLPDMLGSRATQEAITRQVIPLSEETVATTRKSLQGAVTALKKELQEGLLVEGDALPAMVKRVQAIFTNAKRHRAQAIAITESNKAFNNGTLLSAEQSNVVKALKWILSPEPCEICISIEANQPEVPVGAKFRNEDKLFGDVEHPPAHVNCECTLGVVLIEF